MTNPKNESNPETLAGIAAQKIMDNLRATRLILPTSEAQAQDIWEVVRDEIEKEITQAKIEVLEKVKAGLPITGEQILRWGKEWQSKVPMSGLDWTVYTADKLNEKQAGVIDSILNELKKQ